jgi:hypothetical protein
VGGEPDDDLAVELVDAYLPPSVSLASDVRVQREFDHQSRSRSQTRVELRSASAVLPRCTGDALL